MTHLTLSLAAMGVVGAYVLCSLPFLVLLLMVHRLQSDYTRLFIAGLVLQLIPIGLVFFPLGLVGVGMLAYTLVATRRRNAAFRASGLDNPAVHRRWTLEYLANLWAFGFGLEQKGIALLFVDLTAHGGTTAAWLPLAACSLALWTVIGWMLWGEYRRLPDVMSVINDC